MAKTDTTQKKRTDHNAGHRERLRQRFMKGGANALQDYELLELVLFRVHSRRDVKPIAKDLLNRFGDLSAVLTAPTTHLNEIEGVSENTIVDFRLINALAGTIGQNRILNRKAIESWPELIKFCRTKLADKQNEEFHVVFLDKRNQIMHYEEMSKGTVDHAPVYPRDIAGRALELNASSLILVHNHPSGNPNHLKPILK